MRSVGHYVSRALVSGWAVFSVGAPAFAQDAPLEAYAASPSMWDVEISQDGRWIAVGCALDNSPAICLHDLAGEMESRTYPTPDRVEIDNFIWANNRHLIIDLAMTESAEDRWVGNFDEDDVYTITRSLILNAETGASNYLLRNRLGWHATSASIASLDLASPDSILMEMRVRWEEAGFGSMHRLRDREAYNTLYRVDLESGRGREIDTNRTYDLRLRVFTPEGRQAAEFTYRDRDGQYRLVNANGDEILSFRANGSHPEIWGTLDDGRAIGVRFTAGEYRGLRRIDLETGEVSEILPPGSRAEIDYGAITDRWLGAFVGFTSYRDGLPHQDFIDSELGDVHANLVDVLRRAMGSDTRVRLLSWSRDRNTIAVEARLPARPVQYFLFERPANALSPLGSEADRLDGLDLGRVEAFTYAASDGLQIPAYLFLPPGRTRADGPFPLIVMPHGGPAARDDSRFDWEAQYYTSLGYAVLKANFRGSHGYGLAFREAGYGGFGSRMIDDLIDGVSHLVAEGVARHDGYCAVGGSYGGYASLMLAIRDRDNVRCVLAVAPITDPERMLGRFHHNNFRGLERYWSLYMGDVRNDRVAAAAMSIVARADEIQAPVLVIHGVHDQTVSIKESRNLARVTSRSDRFRFVDIPNEDHYFGATSSRTTLLREAGLFLEQYLPAE